MRHQEPFTLPEHPELLDELNEMSIAIKLHHFPESTKSGMLNVNVPKPTWEEVEALIMKARGVINEIRYNPIKY